MKIGSLCTGYGGLDMAVEAVFNAETVWVSEIDKYASQLIKERFSVINHGDLKAINWHEVEPIDILTAGYPCQPFSHAGDRKGLNDERHIFPYILEAISILRPKYAIMENVRGHLSLGFKEVLKGLAEVGYDAKWRIVRASDVGAPHRRERIFIIAYPQSTNSNSLGCSLVEHESGAQRDKGQSQFEPKHLGEQVAANSNNARRIWDSQGSRGRLNSRITSDSDWNEQSRDGQTSKLGSRFNSRADMCLQTPSNPLVDGKLNPKFVEYMMGLPEGWVTDCDISRAQQLKMLGNGVVPQQAQYAIQQLLK
ncbi:Dcm Site-specific DNA methylase [uncultured Caudovirales phage]|uniref:Cytosine-specific methyltransferase n=1 Tax=uncultured Caudovirales phage TaxID=2100421 RepID=A0A6J7X6J6_9CAUD|nr:Dcm Site-specific DNA methylase [uncultured Caudovirales phage]